MSSDLGKAKLHSKSLAQIFARAANLLATDGRIDLALDFVRPVLKTPPAIKAH